MFEVNANWAVLLLGFFSGLSHFGIARKNGLPVQRALGRTASMTAWHVAASFVWLLALNALGLYWASLAGIGVGILVGLAALVVLLASQSLRHRRRHWK
ncbi:hypothetical protein [Sphingomonas sp.]|jgi:hypothetical protein|uniref:hypothetical protein n=1 Tax=Sphingomonas sp. TaxID=28214 RepID=UPI002E0F8A24|nr:hypothetical protein [Sphingomonas sp.]